jgi:addiction module HigA family antidote
MPRRSLAAGAFFSVAFSLFNRLELRNAIELAVFQSRLVPKEAAEIWLTVENDLKAGFLVLVQPAFADLVQEAELLTAAHTSSIGTRSLDFMKPLGLSSCAVAKAIGATPIAISEIIRRKRGVSGEMALKLGRLFNVSPELWMGIQADYDLELARARGESEIFRRVQPLKTAHPVPA